MKRLRLADAGVFLMDCSVCGYPAPLEYIKGEYICRLCKTNRVQHPAAIEVKAVTNFATNSLLDEMGAFDGQPCFWFPNEDAREPVWSKDLPTIDDARRGGIRIKCSESLANGPMKGQPCPRAANFVDSYGKNFCGFHKNKGRGNILPMGGVDLPEK